MKAVILAGGRGTRLESELQQPKPMVRLGPQPILWHILKTYSAHGISDFVIALGHQGYAVKEYFANYLLHSRDVTIDLRSGKMDFAEADPEPWRVALVETGEGAGTGARVRRVREHLAEAPHFCLTYGDGVGNVDIRDTIRFHEEHGRLVTMTVVRPPGRYGGVGLHGDIVRSFSEKPERDASWINGGFFVVSRELLDDLPDDALLAWEDVIERLTAKGAVSAFRHEGFWGCIDTPRDHARLQAAWNAGDAPWKAW